MCSYRHGEPSEIVTVVLVDDLHEGVAHDALSRVVVGRTVLAASGVARAADLGASIDSLASSLRTLVGGEEVSQYKDGDEQYQVVLRLDEPFRNADTMSQLLVPAGPGKTVKVSDVEPLSGTVPIF